MSTGTPSPPSPSSFGTDPLSLLALQFLGRRPTTGQTPFLIITGTVANGPNGSVPTNSEADITIDGFNLPNQPPTSTVRCRFESRWGSHSTAQIPPVGTRCVAVFPSTDPTHSGWIIAFAGWPT